MSNARHCQICKWWGHEQVETLRDYAPDAVDVPARICGNPNLVDIDSLGYRAVGGDGFGLDYPVCNLVTGPEFGCVHWNGEGNV